MLNARLTTLSPYVLGKLQAVLKDWNGTAPSPEIQVFVDAWRALEVWKGSGEVVATVSDLPLAPVMPDLEIASAKLEHDSRAYELDGEQWILVARIEANRKFRIPGTVRAFVADSANLVWLTEVDGGLAAGHFDLQMTPRVRDLRLDRGYRVLSDRTEGRNGADMAKEGMLLARVLPHFLRQAR